MKDVSQERERERERERSFAFVLYLFDRLEHGCQAEFAEAYGQWLRSGDENTHRESVLFDETTGALLAMQGSYSSVLDTNNKNVDVMDVMDNTIQWFADNDPTHTSVFHSNDLEYRGATLQNISISGMIR